MVMNKQGLTSHHEGYANDWNRINFIDCAEQILDFRGKTPKKLGMEWDNGTILALSANNVKMGKVDFEAETYFGSEELYNKWMTKGELHKGDVLMTMEAPLGNIAQVPTDGKYILSQRVIAIKTKSFLSNTFFKYYLMSPRFQKLLETNSTGTTAKGISQKNLNNLEVLVPPLPEQRKIAAILTSVDDAITATQRIIDQTKVVKRGLMQQLLTKGIGHTTFKQTEIGEIPTEWQVRRLVDVTTKIGDGIHATPNYDESGTIPFINGNNIKNKSIYIPSENKMINEDEYKKYVQYLNENTIFLSINGTIGNLGFYNGEDVLLGKSIAYINLLPELLSREYLFYYLGSQRVRDFFTRELTGTTIKNLSLKTIRETVIPVPMMSEQKLIASVLSTFDKKVEIETEKLASLSQLKFGLMQVLLTGQARVNVDEPSEVSV